ncbi:hypothetical protein [Actinomadura sp. 9N407]|uniref:hypothetical protein n=1 Tax=Actinomadura sp. 9N407 TaxID=3375154 RepID=UPI0037AAFC18
MTSGKSSSLHPLANTWSAVLWLLISAALVVGAVLLLVFSLPGKADEKEAFKTAEPCASAPQAPADCLWTQEFTVSEIQLYEGRGSDITATLTPDEGTGWQTEYRNDEPVLENLRDGDRVTGTIWRGQIVKIAAKDAEQFTVDSPTDLAEAVLGTVLVMGPPGLLLMVLCGWRLRRRSEPGPSSGMGWGVGLVVGLAMAGLVAGMVVTARQDPLWAIPAIWLPLAALMSWGTVHIARMP